MKHVFQLNRRIFTKKETTERIKEKRKKTYQGVNVGRKRKIDFIIYEEQDERLVFRFYPRQSSCHSFGNSKPKSWNEVYKVYYSYSILRQDKYDKNNNWETEVMFECYCDECSIIDDIAYICNELSNGIVKQYTSREGQEKVIEYLDREFSPLGDGVSWTISKFPQTNYYQFTLWKYHNIGFRFELVDEKIKEFGDYLKNCCEHMLLHGQCI